MMVSSRPILALMACAAILFSAAAQAAEEFPSRPIRIVVPYPPGGSMDQNARFYAHKLTAALGKPVIVENRAGAEGAVGLLEVVKSKPDGHTLAIANVGTHAVNPHLYNLPFDPLEDFTPITQASRSPPILIVSAASPFHTVADLVDYAKKNPGKVNFGSIATHSQVFGEIVKRNLGIDMVHIPYKGTPDALRGLLGGDIQMVWDSAMTAIAQAKGGKVRMLAVAGTARLAVAPDVPTADEAGIQGMRTTTWTGFFAPKGLPPAILKRLNEELVKAVHSPEARDMLVPFGNVPTGTTPEEFDAIVRRDHAFFGEVIREIGLRK